MLGRMKTKKRLLEMAISLSEKKKNEHCVRDRKIGQ